MPESQPSEADYESLLIDMAVESWRLSRLFLRVANKLDAGESTRYVNQLRFFQRQVEENLRSAGLTLVNVEGQEYDPGMAASALNGGDFEPGDRLVIDQMVEPIIMSETGIRRTGTITLRKTQQ
jgi:hypothetical protein